MKQAISLVLSGGGARGIAHIGVIEELIEQGFEIKSIAGSSMGAIVAGMYALGKLQEYKEWLYKLDKIDAFGLLDFTLSKRGLIKGNKIFKKLKKVIPDENIENMNIPYIAVATDIINRKEIIFDKGSFYEAIRASVSIPTLVTPSKQGNDYLVDGGVLNPLPLNRVKRTENDILVAVFVNAELPDYENSISEKKKKMGYFDLMNKTTALMTHKIAMLHLQLYPPDILIKVSRKIGNVFQLYKAEEFVEIGRNAAKQQL